MGQVRYAWRPSSSHNPHVRSTDGTATAAYAPAAHGDANLGAVALGLRIALGMVIFPHGAQKLLGWFGSLDEEATMNVFARSMRILTSRLARCRSKTPSSSSRRFTQRLRAGWATRQRSAAPPVRGDGVPHGGHEIGHVRGDRGADLPFPGGCARTSRVGAPREASVQPSRRPHGPAGDGKVGPARTRPVPRLPAPWFGVRGRLVQVRPAQAAPAGAVLAKHRGVQACGGAGARRLVALLEGGQEQRALAAE